MFIYITFITLIYYNQNKKTFVYKTQTIHNKRLNGGQKQTNNIAQNGTKNNKQHNIETHFQTSIRPYSLKTKGTRTRRDQIRDDLTTIKDHKKNTRQQNGQKHNK